MASHGGTISIEAERAGAHAGLRADRRRRRRRSRSPSGSARRNVLCTDIGGTSFDIALITDGRFEITPTPDIARFVLNMPLVQIDSIGAGTGSFVRVNPNSNRPGARARLGRRADRRLLARGRPRDGLDHRPQPRARAAQPRLLPRRRRRSSTSSAPSAEVERQVAEPLGLGVEEAAAGVIELFEQTLRNEAVGRILGKGYSPADYTLLCYGGGGPLHVAGYTDGRPLPRRAGAGVGGGLLGLRLRLRRLRVPLRPDHRHADPAGARTSWRRRAIGDDDHRRLAGAAGAGRRRVREVGRSTRERDQLHPRGADAVLRPAQRHRDRLARTWSSSDGAQLDDLIAAFEDAYAQGLRALGPLARARLPGHPGDRARARSRSRSRRCRSCRARSRAPPPVKETPRRCAGGATGFADDRRSSSSTTSRAGHAIEGPAIVESVGDHLRDPARARRAARRAPDLPPARTRRPEAMARSSTRPRELEPREPRRRSAGTAQRSTRCSPTPSGCSPRPATTTGSRRAGAEGVGPDRLREALLAAARRPRLGARDGAEHLRLADRPRAGRALLRALHAGGRLGRALDRDHRPRPHDVGRDQVHGPQRLGGQPRDPAGRHLRQQRPDDRRRPQRRRADLRADLLGRAS